MKDQSRSHHRERTFAALLLAAACFVAGFLLGTNHAPAVTPPEVPAMVWPRFPPLDDFTLGDQHGARFDARRLDDRWTLLFFGYTHCPDICPTTLATLKQVRDTLRGFAPFDARGQVVLVSVDGARDTPQQLARYLGHFDPDFIGASGSDAELETLTAQLGLRIVRVSTDDPQDYWFEHPASVLLLDPARRIVGEFAPPLDVADIAAQLRHIIAWGETAP
ncbi:MAG: SCO family protein [Gammaproteobacteria bacterium]